MPRAADVECGSSFGFSLLGQSFLHRLRGSFSSSKILKCSSLGCKVTSNAQRLGLQQSLDLPPLLQALFCPFTSEEVIRPTAEEEAINPPRLARTAS